MTPKEKLNQNLHLKTIKRECITGTRQAERKILENTDNYYKLIQHICPTNKGSVQHPEAFSYPNSDQRSAF